MTPVSLEQVKQEQDRMVVRDTDWNTYDYTNVYQNKYVTYSSFKYLEIYIGLFYSYKFGELSYVSFGLDNMDREDTKPDLGHLL